MRCRFGPPLLLLIGLCLLHPLAGAATPRVEVIETWPAGGDVRMRPNQTFYLHLTYDTDAPVGIWARPYFRGRPVEAGSNPSPKYLGQGEALGWFFLMQPGTEVDEIRIRAGSGRTQDPVVTVWQGHIVADEAAAAAADAPAWVSQMRGRAEAEQQAAARQQALQPTRASDVVLLGGFMLIMLVLCVSGLTLPAWAIWRWKGGWRVAAAVPAAIMGWVVLRIVLGVARDPTSHNLWPFEILQSGMLSLVLLAILAALRRRGARRTGT